MKNFDGKLMSPANQNFHDKFLNFSLFSFLINYLHRQTFVLSVAKYDDETLS